MWHWLVHTDAGLLTRIVIGAGIFLVLAIVDWRRRGREATRWREYLFLLVCAAAAIIYGVVNDQLTSRISWEYFYFGKGLDEVLGPIVPPDMARLHLAAIKVGVEATWSVGLIIGVALLLANNPRVGRKRLGYGQLCKALAIIFGITILLAIIFGIAGYEGLPSRFSEDFRQMVLHDEFRPYLFMCVFGVHLGGYVGGLLGCVVAVAWVMKKRKSEKIPA